MIVLFIEDPEQDVSLKNQLSNTISVIEAFSFEKGFNLAKKKDPDVIIVPVVLEKNSGFSFCKRLKEDEELRKIPVIIKEKDEKKDNLIKALQCGAIDLISDSIDPEVLRLKIKNIVETQSDKNRDANLKYGINFSGINSEGDKEFVVEVISHISEHYSNTNFGVYQLAGLMHVSKRSLYRRLDCLQLSPGELIKEIRLRTAKNLLKRGKSKSVSDVAGKVGYKSANYFSQAFFDQYGVKPTSFFNDKS